MDVKKLLLLAPMTLALTACNFDFDFMDGFDEEAASSNITSENRPSSNSGRSSSSSSSQRTSSSSSNGGYSSSGNWSYSSSDPYQQTSSEHRHDYYLSYTRNASISSEGLEVYRCSECDEYYVKVTSPKLKYQYNLNWNEETEKSDIFCGVSSEEIYDIDEITVPNYIYDNLITSIGDNWNCIPSAKKFSFGRNIAKINVNAFNAYPNLEEIEVEDDNQYFTSIDGVLYNKEVTKLLVYPAGKKDKEFTLPDTVIEIAQNAFRGCNNLVKIHFNSNLTVVNNNSFVDCFKLMEVDFRNTEVTSIPGYCFSNCYNIIRVYLSSNISSIGQYPFGGSSKIREIYNLTGKELDELKENYDPNNYSYYGNFFDSYNKFIHTSEDEETSILLDSTYGFYYYYNENEMRNHIIALDYDMDDYEYIHIPSNSYVDNYAFSYSPIKRVSFGSNVALSYQSFSYSKITSLNLPNDISVDNEAFYSCQNLRSITIPDNLANNFYLSDYACSYCQSLVLVNCYDADYMETINNYLHNYGTYQNILLINTDQHDKKAHIENSDDTIYLVDDITGSKYLLKYQGAYDNEFTLDPNTVSIAKRAFASSESDLNGDPAYKPVLKKLIIPETSEKITITQNSFEYACIDEVEIRCDVSTIESNAFNYAHISSLSFNNVGTIQQYAFQAGYIRNLVFEGDINIILSDALTGINYLKTLRFKGNVDTIEENAFRWINPTLFELPHNITSLTRSLFGCVNYIECLIVPSSVVSVDSNVFGEDYDDNYYFNTSRIFFEGSRSDLVKLFSSFSNEKYYYDSEKSLSPYFKSWTYSDDGRISISGKDQIEYIYEWYDQTIFAFDYE